MSISADELRFQFGKNWQNFIAKAYDEDRLKAAIFSLKEFLQMDSLSGKIFLDLGSGSGLFSLAALRLGAKKILSIDIDPFSVECTRFLWTKEGRPRNWEVIEGSVLDDAFIVSLGKADIVYSWGVLHHTGNMWKALGNAALPVKEEGYLFISIYNDARGRFLDSNKWEAIKKVYNISPRIVQKAMLWCHASYSVMSMIFRGVNPIKYISNYKSQRGMSWYTDNVDWVGGYPYQYAGTDALIDFYRPHGFVPVNVKPAIGLETNEMLFKKEIVVV